MPTRYTHADLALQTAVKPWKIEAKEFEDNFGSITKECVNRVRLLARKSPWAVAKRLLLETQELRIEKHKAGRPAARNLIAGDVTSVMQSRLKANQASEYSPAPDEPSISSERDEDESGVWMPSIDDAGWNPGDANSDAITVNDGKLHHQQSASSPLRSQAKNKLNFSNKKSRRDTVAGDTGNVVGSRKRGPQHLGNMPPAKQRIYDSIELSDDDSMPVYKNVVGLSTEFLMCLTEQEVPKGWVTEAVVNAVMHLLETVVGRTNFRYFESSQREYLQKQDECGSAKVLYPISTDNHWLLAVMWAHKNEVVVYNSKPSGSYVDNARPSIATVYKHIAKKPKFSHEAVMESAPIIQNDDLNCGIIILAIAFSEALGTGTPNGRLNYPVYREVICELLRPLSACESSTVEDLDAQLGAEIPAGPCIALEDIISCFQEEEPMKSMKAIVARNLDGHIQALKKKYPQEWGLCPTLDTFQRLRQQAEAQLAEALHIQRSNGLKSEDAIYRLREAIVRINRVIYLLRDREESLKEAEVLLARVGV